MIVQPMDVEAVVAVGLATLVLGAVLFGVSRFWLRSSMGRNVRTSSPRLTRAGIILGVAFVLLLFVGFGAAYFAPWYDLDIMDTPEHPPLAALNNFSLHVHSFI